MRKTINLLALFILVSVNVFTSVSYAQLDDSQIPVPEAVDQNSLPEINDWWDFDNEDQNVDEILEDKVGKTTNSDDNSWWEGSEKEDDEKTWVEDVPEVSDNMWWSLIDIVADMVDEYFEAEESKVEESKAEEPEAKELGVKEPEVKEPEVENEVFDKSLLDFVKELVLWVEDSQVVQDLELYFVDYNWSVSHYTIMDRNLGASEVYNQDWDNQNIESYWYIYQRWNNYGFTSTATSNLVENMTGIQTPKSVRSEYMPSLFASNVRYRGNDSWMWWGGMYDNIWWWMGDTRNADWNSTTQTGRQWPCPSGYYIPSVRDWSNLRTKWFESRIHNSNEWFRADFANDFLLSPAGVRKNEMLNGGVFNVGNWWEYRTSSPSTNTWAYVLYFYKDNSLYNDPLPDRSRSMWASLRCFKNDFESDWNLNFHLNWGGQGVIAVNYGKFTSLSSPSRLVSIFEGWYTTPDFQTWTKLWVWSGTDGVTDLYAKWWCFEWYVLSGDECVRWTKVTFNSKCWFSQSSITVPYWTILDFSWEVVNLSNWMTATITWVADSCPWETFAWWNTWWNDNYRTIKTLVIQDGQDDINLNGVFRGDLTITFDATKNWWETDTGYISVPYGTLIDLSEYTASKGSWWVRTFLWRNTDSDATWGFLYMYKAENEDSNDTRLYAIFRKDKFNVNFDTNGHGTVPATQVINRWEKVSNPWNLTAPWYNFEWWSDNEYLTTSFDFWTNPTDDVTLYAKWRAPWAECYEWFEYDDNLWMCIKKNEWVIRVWLGWGMILSSWYSDFLEDLVSLFITWDYKSKMWNFDIAKNYYWIMLAENEDILDVYSNGSLNTEWQIVKVFEGNHDEWDLLFTMVTKALCRWNEPNCKFYNQNIEVAEWIPEWYNLKLFIPEDLKQQFGGSLTWVVRADNIRIIFDPRVVVTFDSNWHWVSPERQILNKWSRIINPWSLSAVWYEFIGWSDDEYLMSIFDFNTVVDRDIKLYAKWKTIWDIYSCPEWQEYDNSVGLCKRPKDWVIRIWYQWDMEFSSWYSLFLDNVLLSGLNLEMSESEVEAFKKAFWILFAVLETFDWTDEIVIDEAGVVADGDLWLLNYYNKDWKLLFTVVVDMAWTENNSSWWSINLIIHTRSTYVNVARDVSSLDNLKLVPSSTGINEYVEAYPPIAQLENLWIIFSDRMEPNIIDNWWNHYSWWWKRVGEIIDTWKEHGSAVKQSETNESDIDRYDSRYSQELNEAYQFSYNNMITTVDTIKEAKMYTPIKRIEMAKMLSYYAMNVLWQKPDDTLYISFKDVSDRMNAEYDNWVILAYQLWIMWINMPNNKFRPNDYVTRAEFATALSRMLFGLDDWRPNYYSTHFEKLKSEWIMTKLDPNMLEIRWYVMLMLMRSVK